MATTPNGGQYLFERLEAKRSATLIQVSALVVAALCIVLAAVMQDPINEQRKDLQLVMQSDIYKELPPEYAWVSAAGGTFRGLAADVLWVRAEQLKQDGKYYESHQLAKWICLLQPRFPAVWQFQAWNMSYNISVGTHTPQERWQWVYNGIRLLRDEGIPNNERIVKLYHQLGWTFFHKVGDRADDFHRYYKRMLAATMETLLGPPPVTMDNQKSIDWFRPIAEAPHTLRELIESKPGVAELVETLDDLGIDLEAGTNPQNIYHPLEATFFHPYTNYLGEKDFAALRSKPLELSEKEEKLFEFFANAPNQDFDALLAYLRSKVLREQYKMNPQFMLDMTGKLGVEKPVPIEWRSPWAHSLYWTLYGTTRGRELKNIDEFDLINTDRILLFSLAELAKQGRYVFRINLDDPLQSYLILMPDIRYIEAMHKKYIELGKVYANEGEVVENTTSELLRPGHVNNLEQAIAALYLSGKKEKARYYFDYLTQYYKHLYTKETEKRYLLNLDEFVQNTQLKEMAGGIKDTIYLIYSTMESAYLALSRGVADEFDSSIRAAELFYKKYQKDHLDSREGRQTLPPFVQMRAWALYAFVTSNAYPLLDRSIVWDRELDDVKKQCYDVVGPVVKAQCEQVNIDVAKAFPEPPGMAQWRKTHPTPTSPEDIVKQYKEKQKAKAGKQ